MLDMKKKLSSLIPSSARAQLQNVLTVEWDNSKTVLVEVPGAGERSSEMEMSGMDSGAGRENSNYGRLADEDEEMEALFNNKKANYHASRDTTGHSKITKQRPPALTPRPYAYQSSSTSAVENPFDDNSAANLNSSSGGYDTSRSGYNSSDVGNQNGPKGWQSFDGHQQERKKAANTSQNPWGLGGEWNSQMSSPTSSRGTRESANYAEDPFR